MYCTPIIPRGNRKTLRDYSMPTFSSTRQTGDTISSVCGECKRSAGRILVFQEHGCFHWAAETKRKKAERKGRCYTPNKCSPLKSSVERHLNPKMPLAPGCVTKTMNALKNIWIGNTVIESLRGIGDLKQGREKPCVYVRTV